jgi:hypothetical protein
MLIRFKFEAVAHLAEGQFLRAGENWVTFQTLQEGTLRIILSIKEGQSSDPEKKMSEKEHQNEAFYVTVKVQMHEHNWKELGGGGELTKYKGANFRWTRSSLLASVVVMLFQYGNLDLTKLKYDNNKLSITDKEKVNERTRPNSLSN